MAAASDGDGFYEDDDVWFVLRSYVAHLALGPL